MRSINKVILGITLLGIFSSAICAMATEREELTKAAVQEIESLALPYTHFHQVEYDPGKCLVVVKFKTGSQFKWNYNLFYLLWWDMQFVALNAFEKRDLKIETVGVITNYEDGSGPLLMMTKAVYIRKYANAVHGMGKWLDLTDGYHWDEASQKWDPVPK